MNDVVSFNFLEQEEINAFDLGQKMEEHMVLSNVYSTCAPDVGYGYNVIGINSDEAQIFFNPRIIKTSTGVELGEEFFSNKPGFSCKIKRAEHITMRATNYAGETITIEFIGQTARCIQHEMDKIDGVDPLSRANKYHKDQANKKYMKLKHNIDVGGSEIVV